MGVTILPVYVAVNGKEYKDYEDISSEDFLELIAEGGIPSSSQPSIEYSVRSVLPIRTLIPPVHGISTGSLIT